MEQEINILLIEDNPGDEFLLRELFHFIPQMQCALHSVSTLQEAFLWLTEHTCDLILLDLNLPDSNGISTLKNLYPAAPWIPIVVLTGLNDQETANQAIQQGAQDFLVKGEVNEEVLARTIRYSIQRKQVEIQLSESQRTYATLLNNLPGMAYRCLDDDDWTMIVLSDGCYALTGYPVDAFLQNQHLSFNSLIHPKDRDLVHRTVQESSEKDRSFEIFYRIIRADGGIRFVYEKGERVISQVTGERFLEGFIMDVTATREAQEALNQSENRFKLLINSFNDIVFTLDTRLRFTGLYGDWVEKLGYIRSELIGKTARNVMGSEIGSYHEKASKQALSGETVIYEWSTNTSGTDTYYQTTMSPIFSLDKKIMGLVGVGRDITELKKTERNLRASQDLAQSLANSLSERICVIDADQKIITTNAAWEVHTLLSGIEDIGLTGIGTDYFQAAELILHMAPEDKAKSQAGILEVLRGKLEKFSLEYHATYREEKKWFLQRVYPLIDYHRGVVISLEDITSRKNYELEQEAMINLSSALRTTLEREQMITLILDEIQRNAEYEQAVFIHWNGSSAQGLVEEGRGDWHDLKYISFEVHPSSIFMKAFQEKKSITLNSFTQNTENMVPDLLGHPSNLTCFPLITNEELVGVILITRSRPFNEKKSTNLERLCTLAASAIRQVSLLNQTRERLKYLDALHAIDQVIISSMDRHFTVDLILDQLLDQETIDHVDLLLYNPNTNYFELNESKGIPKTLAKEKQWFLPNSIDFPIVIHSRKIQSFPNLTQKSPILKHRGLDEAGLVIYHVVPLHAKGKILGAIELFGRKTNQISSEQERFLSAVADLASISLDNITLFEELHSNNMKLVMAYDTTIAAWAEAMDIHEAVMLNHSQKIAEMTVRFARFAGIPEKEIKDIQYGALLHDIGEIGIPDSILNKPGTLSSDEWEHVKEHPNLAYKILSKIPFLKNALDIPYCHHECWDGSGYPRGLQGEHIPYPARLFKLIDVWSALNSDRPYRKAFMPQEAVELIQQNSGILFDPDLTRQFILFLATNERLYGNE